MPLYESGWLRGTTNGIQGYNIQMTFLLIHSHNNGNIWSSMDPFTLEFGESIPYIIVKELLHEDSGAFAGPTPEGTCQ